ncbi:molybdopterin converting factor subunit 1 [Hoeflea poritis]|uniref:Molybdopterin converting factor subunit 1 n=1 Tax=Hoeflea poritis TaxID=2993659 RepID=A0ABT4VSJ6_9HYPH|nr:molybdopterin converting factor subunit 1 [Hoeflea poritis]MDA4846983.1 molybdopterin converting factor subunit 1 [Hoeflea poritis]
MVKLVYFAWIRERIGKSEEEIELPDDVETIADLIGHLRTRGEEYALALQVPEVVHVAINQEHRQHSDPVSGAREIALFPPMTGG